MRVLIVDDEPLARTLLAELLGAIDGVEVVGQAGDGFEAVRLAEALGPDLMLLDVQMPKLSGLEVLELLGPRAPGVVFVTAHDEFALRAFEVHAVDYVLKPVQPARLETALARARERLREPAARPSAGDLVRAARPGQFLERVLIREDARVHVLPVAQIDFIEAQDDYLWFVAGTKRLRKQQTLAELGAQLDPARFPRIHRSFLLNIERLARIEPYAKDSWQAILATGAHLPISKSGYTRLRELLR
ncbi:MAG: LytR/AlgR family response regulator transcription factor [Steroidobacteraceae bacterium]